MNFNSQPHVICRKFRAHAQGHTLANFKTKHNETQSNLPKETDLTLENVNSIVYCIIIGFR